MKVYVDELPKSCGDCVFCKQTEYCYYCDKLHTKLGYVNKEKDCPLQSLADYTKQVRKEVCEEIKSAIKEKLTYPDNRVDCPFDNGYPDEDTICSVLDQIQGENCCYGKI